MRKWEYRVVCLKDLINVHQAQLQVFGDDGWELASVDGGVAYLKRDAGYEVARQEELDMGGLPGMSDEQDFNGSDDFMTVYDTSETRAKDNAAKRETAEMVHKMEASTMGALFPPTGDVIQPGQCFTCWGTIAIVSNHVCNKDDVGKPVPGWLRAVRLGGVKSSSLPKPPEPPLAGGMRVEDNTGLTYIDSPIAGPPVLKVKRFHPDAKLPVRGTPESSGLDLYALKDYLIRKNSVISVATGVGIEIPERMEATVRPRSSMALKGVVAILGSIDRDYVGELSMPMTSYFQDYWIKKGDRVAQLVLSPVHLLEVEEVDELRKTSRGTSGFGSTGK